MSLFTLFECQYLNNGKFNFIQIDVYGKCGRKKCPLNEDCKAFISKEYKFYLAFENSVCTDYITEKFFNILRHDIVPVVWGGGNYEYYVSYFKIFVHFRLVFLHHQLYQTF